MENLINSKLPELQNIIKGIVMARDYFDTIDNQYQLEFKVAEHGDKAFKITYSWFLGVIPGNGGDPQNSQDPKYIPEVDHFIILKSESLRKFTKEVVDAIDQVCKAEFDEEYDEILL